MLVDAGTFANIHKVKESIKNKQTWNIISVWICSEAVWLGGSG